MTRLKTTLDAILDARETTGLLSLMLLVLALIWASSTADTTDLLRNAGCRQLEPIGESQVFSCP